MSVKLGELFDPISEKCEKLGGKFAAFYVFGRPSSGKSQKYDLNFYHSAGWDLDDIIFCAEGFLKQLNEMKENEDRD